MVSDLDANLEAYYTALWIGALLAAGDGLDDPFPAELEPIAAAYFERCPPSAKA
jgi:hypothetical protein